MATQGTGSGEKKSRLTRERILAAAEEMFAARGYNNTSLRELTAKAKVNLSVVYYYFESKEDLLLACVEKYLRPMLVRETAAIAALRERANGNAISLRDLISALTHVRKFSSPETTQRFRSMVFSLTGRMSKKVFRACKEMMEVSRMQALGEFVRACPHLESVEVCLRYASMNAAIFGLQTFAQYLNKEFPKSIPESAYFEMFVSSMEALFAAPASYRGASDGDPACLI